MFHLWQILPKMKPRNMPQTNYVKLACEICKQHNYWVHKNKKTVDKKLELKKFCSTCRKHSSHKEKGK